MLSRRQLLISSPALWLGFARGATAAERWLDRQPDEWTPADIQDVLDRSAWTREVTLNSAPSERDGHKEKRPAPSQFKVVVRWESGLPLRLARRVATMRDKGPDRYVISVTRMPVEFIAASAGQKSKEAAEADIAAQLAKSCSIDRDGKEAIHAERAYWVYDRFSSRVEIVFPRVKDPIHLEDWEVTIAGRTGDFLLRARFSLKPMVYRGELEL